MGTWTTGRLADLVRCVGVLVSLLELVLRGTSRGESILVEEDADYASSDLMMYYRFVIFYINSKSL
jgi:hypothetical protein